MAINEYIGSLREREKSQQVKTIELIEITNRRTSGWTQEFRSMKALHTSTWRFNGNNFIYSRLLLKWIEKAIMCKKQICSFARSFVSR